MKAATGWCILILVGVLVKPGGVLAQEDPLGARPEPKPLRLVEQTWAGKKLGKMLVPEGIAVEVWQRPSADVRPARLAYAEDGTAYLLEVGKMSTIRQLIPREGAWAEEPGRVVVQEAGLASLLHHDGWLYVGGPGGVKRLRPGKPEGPFEQKEPIVSGLGGVVTGLTLSDDGWLYLSVEEGTHDARGTDDSKIRLRGTGAILRCRSNGLRLELFTLGLRHPQGPVQCDALGNPFLVDAAHGAAQGWQILHLLEGSDFGWRTPSVSCVPAQALAELSVDEPLASAVTQNKQGRPTPLHCLSETTFPERLRGTWLRADPAQHRVMGYRLEFTGSTYRPSAEMDWLRSEDSNFQPCQVVSDPTGALVIVDQGGRLLRLTWAGVGEEPALPPREAQRASSLRKAEDQELIKVLSSESAFERGLAVDELRRRGDRNRVALLKVAEDPAVPLHGRLAAIQAASSVWSDELAAALQGLLKDLEPELRTLAVELLGRNKQAQGVEVYGLLEDGEPLVRRAAALAIARTAAAGSADLLVQTLLSDAGKHPRLTQGLLAAVERLGNVALERLIAAAESGDQRMINRVVDALSHLRGQASTAAIPRLLRNPHLSMVQRATLLRASARMTVDDEVSLKPVSDYLTDRPEEVALVKLAGLDALARRGAMRAAETGPLLLRLLDDEESSVRLTAISALVLGQRKDAIAALTQRSKDAQRPEAEREAARKALEVLAR